MTPKKTNKAQSGGSDKTKTTKVVRSKAKKPALRSKTPQATSAKPSRLSKTESATSKSSPRVKKDAQATGAETAPKKKAAKRSPASREQNAGSPDIKEDSPLNQPPKKRRVAPLRQIQPSEHPVGDSNDDPYPVGTVDIGMLGIGSPVFPPNLGVVSDSEGELGGEDTSNSTRDEALLLADDPSVEARIREIDERLDGLMASPPHEDLDLEPAPDTNSITPPSAEAAVDAAREVLESNYYRQRWGKRSLHERANDVDDFGRDPEYEKRLRGILDFLFKKYFRVEVDGIRHVPNEGRAVIVANHSGALPFDGVMLREAIRHRHPNRNDLRWLAEDFSFYLPFLGVTLNRIGAVRACPENAERLLASDHLVGVFPEGAEGIKKLYKDRYQLQRFGRGGFIRLCLKMQCPIIPCAIVGAEETNPILYRFDNLSKLLGLDYLPITPTFPVLGPLGLLPAPTKWKIVFGEPISLDEYGPQAAKDHVLVGRLSERVRASVSDLLESSLRRRRSIWL